MSAKHSSAPPNFAVWSTNKTAGRGVVSGQLSVGSGEKGRSAELSVFSFQLSAEEGPLRGVVRRFAQFSVGRSGRRGVVAWPSLAMPGDILLVLSETVLILVFILDPLRLIRCALKTGNCPLREASAHCQLKTPRSGLLAARYSC